MSLLDFGINVILNIRYWKIFPLLIFVFMQVFDISSSYV